MGRRAAAIGLAAAVFSFGLLAHNHFPNDHFVHLSMAAQMLAGEWPARDFADPGMPLMYAVSAAAQWIGGRTLLAEAVLVYGAFAAGAAILAAAVVRMTGSPALGLWAGASIPLIAPRTYGYPKVLLYAAAVYAFVWAAQTRSRRVPLALAALTATAFLFRHDHGLFIGAAGAALIVTAPASPRERLHRLAACAGLIGIMLLPYAAYVHAATGLLSYVRSALEFSRQEAQRTGLSSWMPPLHAGPTRPAAAATLFYAFWALPILTIAAARLRGARPPSSAAAVALSLLAVAVNAGFIRDRIEDRISDAIVPAAALAALLTGSTRERTLARAGALLGLMGLALAAASVGELHDRFARSRIAEGPAAAASRLQEVVSQLLAPRAPPQLPSAIALALIPFFDYVEACTRPNDTLFVPGFAPEVPYFARRRFAGGHVALPGAYYSSEEEQRRTVTVLEQQSVPLVVLPPGSRPSLERHHPRVSAWLRQFAPMGSYRDHQDRVTEVWVRAGLPRITTHAPTGFPCFR